MVPPSQALAGAPGAAGSKAPALPGAVPGALAGGLTPALGPITGVSTINSRLPSAQFTPSPVAALQNKSADDDDDDEPNAKKPRLDDGSLVPEAQWAQKYPAPIS